MSERMNYVVVGKLETLTHSENGVFLKSSAWIYTHLNH